MPLSPEILFHRYFRNKMLRESEPLSGPDGSELFPAMPSVDSTADVVPSEKVIREAITQTKEPV